MPQSHATFDSLIARVQATRDRLESRRAEAAAGTAAIAARAQREGRSWLTPEEQAQATAYQAERHAVREDLRATDRQLADLRRQADEDAEATAAANRSTPGARPGTGGPGSQHAVAGGSWRDDAAPWIREDGRPAALDRAARAADNPVVAELAERDPAHHVTEMYSGLGALVRALSTTGASSLVPTLWSGSLIDRARAAARVIEAGAETIPMDSKQLNIGRLTQDVPAGWVAEGGTRTPGDPAFDMVSLVAKTMYAFTTASIEFLQDAPNADQVIEDSIGKSMGLALDLAALFGGATGPDFTAATGAQASPPGPLGILGSLLANYPAGVLGAATNGTPITPATPWNELLATYFGPVRNNEQVTAILLNAAMAQKYAQTYDSLGQPLRAPPVLDNIPQLVTNQIPSFTQGTMTSVATDIFAGDFRQVLIGTRLDFTLQVLSERYAELGSVGLLMTFRGDIALARPRAMACYRAIGGS